MNPSYFTLLLGYVLHLANAAPPSFGKDDFYALKDRLLRRFGEQCVGHDWQHITKKCWTCYGDGCHRCGDGIYDEFWTQLERWVLGDERFHRPVQRFARDPGRPVTIDGYVRHANVDHRTAAEARLWLYLFFAPALWRRSMHGGSSFMTPGLRPMLILQCIAFRVRFFWSRWIPQRRCYKCGGWVFRPFSHGVYFVCWLCDRRERARFHAIRSQMEWQRANGIEEDVPF